MDDWAADLCRCGHTRAVHRLGPRGPWPATGRTYTRCTECDCRALDVDPDALARAAAEVAADRLAGVRDILTHPLYLKRRQPR